MKYLRLLSFFFLALCALFGHAVANAEKLDQLYTVRYPWRISQKADMLSEPFWIGPDGTLLELPIIPDNLFELETDITTPDGKLILPQGTQLMKVVGDVTALCTVLNPSNKELKRFRKITKTFNLCFTNDEKDPDSWKMHSGPMYPLAEREYIYKAWKEIYKFSVKEIDPKFFLKKERILINYAGYNFVSGELIFDICLNHKSICFVRMYSVLKSSLPEEISILKGLFKIENKEGRRILVRQLIKIPDQYLLIDNTPYN